MREPVISNYTFGEVKVRVQGLGVYFGGEYLRKQCADLTLEAAQKANREAWKQSRTAVRVANRVCNFTIHGSSGYDHACLHHNVAQAVAKETWKRICQIKES